jgi:hypothetical protein
MVPFERKEPYQILEECQEENGGAKENRTPICSVRVNRPTVDRWPPCRAFPDVQVKIHTTLKGRCLNDPNTC